MPGLGLVDVLPAVAEALGVPGDQSGTSGLVLPSARHVIVVLVDGLGEELLRGSLAHAPYLRRALADASGQIVVHSLRCGFPATTAVSMATLGTGRLPGAHGMVGLEVVDPRTGGIVNHLHWDPAIDPVVWQPLPTVFERVAAAGRDVVRIGPSYFDGSGLTEATLRGGRFASAESLDERIDAAIAASRQARHGSLIYLYWGQLDKVGHQKGCASPEWAVELELVDAGLGRLVRAVSKNTLVVITADHGMIDVPLSDRIDIAHEPELAAGVRVAAGDPRAMHVYCEDGAVADVLAAWRARLGAVMDVHSRAEAVAAGLFGPVSPRALGRIGDIVAVATGSVAVADSRRIRREYLEMIGQHGALTEAEQAIPLIAVPGGMA